MNDGHIGLKSGLYFRIIMVFFALTCGLILGMCQGTNGFFRHINRFSGRTNRRCFIWFLYEYFAKTQIKKFEPLRRQMAEQQRIVIESGANHKKEGIGSWLFITSELLLFKSHNFNIQNQELI